MKMKKRSLQGIEDFYLRLGFSGNKLRNTLEKDKEYQRLLKERRKKLTRKSKASQKEKKLYVLSTDQDFEILEKCKLLERKKLSKEDKHLVRLIKTQLKQGWRPPLVKELERLLKKSSR